MTAVAQDPGTGGRRLDHGSATSAWGRKTVIGHVLIVDDSLTVRMDLGHEFTTAGFHPVLCGTIVEARRALSRMQPAAVVLDVLLPDGDGIDLLREIRSMPTLETIPIILLSTEADVTDRIRGFSRGADDYVAKPYDAGYLVARASELVRERAGQRTDDRSTILIIDDSPTYLEELRNALDSAGYVVLTAENGEEGLRVAASQRPAAMIVDGMMPGIDGGTVIRRVRMDVALREMPCILLTGSEDIGAELRALDAGADAFVHKEDNLEVILARLAAVLRGASTPPESKPSLLGPKRVLVIDDDDAYLHSLSAQLHGDGYDVVLARSGEEAIEILAVQSVDCILLDFFMPGLDGRATCRQIKASPVIRSIPLIMLCALEDREVMIDSLEAGADDVISKSSELEVLKARLHAQLRRKQFEDEHKKSREQLMRRELEATEARAALELAQTKASLIEELERRNRELETFSYSVSHDLRAPLRSIDGFSRALLEDCGHKLNKVGREHLRRVCAAAERMGELIDDLLELSRVSRADLSRAPTNLSEIAQTLASESQRRDPERVATFAIASGLVVEADTRLVHVLLDNLFGNAWKFTSKERKTRIEVGSEEQDGETVYFIRDNGAGFDMAYAATLFSPFRRLHSEAEFPGTGIGLATAYRVVDRHGGRIWAEGEVGNGATIFFTIPRASGPHDSGYEPHHLTPLPLHAGDS